MRFRWLILIALVLSGCGQPLQLNTAPARATQLAAQRRTPAPVGSANTSVPAVSPEAGTALAPLRATDTVTTSTTAAPSVKPAATDVTLPLVVPSVVVVPQTAVPLSNEQRWRGQQIDRVAFSTPRSYRANQSVPLLWFDPANGQSVEIGRLIGTFTAQAEFSLGAERRPALEVPYRINGDFGLTAISDAIRDRMRAAGYTESVEAYVVQSTAIAPIQ